MEKMIINENGIDKIVEFPNEEVKEKFLSKNEKVMQKHICKNNLLRVKNDFLRDGTEFIEVYLDCQCSKDEFETVAVFYDNSLITAKDNFKGWLSQVSMYLIQNDFQIIDERKYGYEN